MNIYKIKHNKPNNTYTIKFRGWSVTAPLQELSDIFIQAFGDQWFIDQVKRYKSI